MTKKKQTKKEQLSVILVTNVIIIACYLVLPNLMLKIGAIGFMIILNIIAIVYIFWDKILKKIIKHKLN